MGWWIPVMIAATAMQTHAAYKQAKMQEMANRRNAELLRKNQELADKQAMAVERKGQEEERLHQLKLQQLKGKQRAAYSASGVVANVGTPLEILEQTDTFGELDAMTIRKNTRDRAEAVRMQGYQYSAKADLLDFTADSLSPTMAGGTSLLSGIGQMGMTYAMVNK